MKRFVDIRGQGTGYRFAFWDTCNDKFDTKDGEQAWDTWNDFKDVCPEKNQDRYKKLCPSWVFIRYAREDAQKEEDDFWGLEIETG